MKKGGEMSPCWGWGGVTGEEWLVGGRPNRAVLRGTERSGRRKKKI